MKFTLLPSIGVLWLSLVVSALAQDTPKMQLQTAQIYFRQGDYRQAVPLFEALLAQKGVNKKNVHYHLGICYFRLSDMKTAQKHLRKGIQQIPFVGDYPKDAYRYLAQAYQYNNHFDTAAFYYKRYLEMVPPKHPDRESVKLWLRQCEFAPHWVEHAKRFTTATVAGIGKEVNSQNDETTLYLHPDAPYQVFFSSTRKEHQSDLFQSVFSMGNWTTDESALSYFNEIATQEQLAGFYGMGGDNVQLVFQRDGKLMTTSPYQQKFTDFAPELHQAAGEDRDFYWFADSLVLFASRRPNGYGGMDLYYATRSKEGKWSDPINMGDRINTPFDEVAPFLEADGKTLRFSAQRPQGVGGMDFYQTVFWDSLLQWSPCQLLLPPFNSAADDLYWRTQPEGWQVHFVSDRAGGEGGLDIYTAYRLMPQMFEPASHTFVDFLQGKAVWVPKQPDSIAEIPKILENITLSTAFYPRSQGNWIGDKALVNQVALLLTKYPEVKIVLTAHTDNSGIREYDALLSVQQAEALANRILEKGAKPEQILLRGCGQIYPIAQNQQPNGNPNMNGRSMNQRIEVMAEISEQTPVNIQYSLPSVSEVMATPEGDQYRTRLAGLSYKVRVLRSPAFTHATIFKESKHLSVEKYPQQEKSNYYIGLEKSFADVLILAQKAKQQGYTDTFIVAYIDGFPIPTDQIEKWIKTYPDLVQYTQYAGQ